LGQENELPPWLKEQISRLQQLQQNLQAIMMQKQQIELEIVETERALEELSKTTTSDSIYKAAGPLLIKSEKDTIEKDLTELENKINQMLKGTQSTTQK
jgi:prefoldin beta subunit